MSEKTWKDYYNPEVNKKATKKFREKNLTSFNFVMHNEHDRDIIARLDAERAAEGGVGGKAKYIKQLIRDDIRRTGFQVPPPDVHALPPVEPVPTTTPEEIEKAEALKLLGL